VLTRCLALLRGINVGGRNIVKMADLRRWLEEIGYLEVTTYIQSGNAIFLAASSEGVSKRIEEKLAQEGSPGRVIVRTLDQMREVVSSSPFAPEADKSHIVTFLSDAGGGELVSASPHLQIVLQRPQEIFFHYDIVDGKLPDPNKLCEKSLGVSATTRNWGVVQALTRLMDSA
jgi:uncharacterized protein (DUF1697 family)